MTGTRRHTGRSRRKEGYLSKAGGGKRERGRGYLEVSVALGLVCVLVGVEVKFLEDGEVAHEVLGGHCLVRLSEVLMQRTEGRRGRGRGSDQP